MNKPALLYTTGSPFARIVRVILDELGLEYEHCKANPDTESNIRAKYTPTLQVPTFWDGDVHLWESGLIVEYLLSTYSVPVDKDPPLASAISRPDHYWHDQLVAASIQTLGTSATTIGQMKWGGTLIDDSDYLTVCAQQFPYLLGWLEKQISGSGEGFQPGYLSFQDIALGCHLDYVLNQPIDIDPQIEKFPNLENLLSRLHERASFMNNAILSWTTD